MCRRLLGNRTGLLANPFNPTPAKNLLEGLTAVQKGKEVGANAEQPTGRERMCESRTRLAVGGSAWSPPPHRGGQSRAVTIRK